MKLYATIKNERGGKKSTSDDTRILIELTYKNKIIGTVGLYSIWSEGQDLGYRIVWRSSTKSNPIGGQVLEEEEKQTGKKQRDESIEWYKKHTGKSPDCPHYINSDKTFNPDGWKFCTQCTKGKKQTDKRITLKEDLKELLELEKDLKEDKEWNNQ